MMKIQIKPFPIDYDIVTLPVTMNMTWGDVRDRLMEQHPEKFAQDRDTFMGNLVRNRSWETLPWSKTLADSKVADNDLFYVRIRMH